MANDVEVFQTVPAAFVRGLALMEIVGDMVGGRPSLSTQEYYN